MIKVARHLFIGNLTDCESNSNIAKVHACKDPCHKNAVGYNGNLPSSHPNYLFLEKGSNLYLNLVDMSNISPHFTNPIFKKAFQFIVQHRHQDLLIHCNLGMSRSSALGIFYLAKRGMLPKNFTNALTEFKKLYANCALGSGFHTYLETNWNDLMSL